MILKNSLSFISEFLNYSSNQVRKIYLNSKIYNIYKNKIIHERHRHRYEVNLDLCDNFFEEGMIFAGMSPDNILPETLELNNHPWFIAVQFHPELKSRPFQPHPLFISFISASLNQSRLL